MTSPSVDKDRARVLPTIILSIAVLLAIVPVIWLVATSFKPQAEAVTSTPQLFSATPTIKAYAIALANPEFIRSILNSAIYSVGATLVAIAIILPAAYAIVRLPFRGKSILLIGVTLAGMIPGIALYLPLYLMANLSGTINTYYVVIIAYAAMFAPQALWFSTTYIRAIPEALEHAAMIDGCSRLQAFRHVTFPLIVPGLTAIFVLGVIFVWNDYILVTVLTRTPDMASVQVSLVNQILNSVGISWPTVTAYVALSMLPIVIFFVWMQRWFVRGIVAGAVKE